MQRRPLIFVVISVLVIALIYSVPNTLYVFAERAAPGWGTQPENCVVVSDVQWCCWTETATEPFGIKFCQDCTLGSAGEDCGSVVTLYPEVQEQPPTPSGPKGPLGSIPEGGGILPELEQTPLSPSPEEIAPTIDCAQTPNDPLCETATIPESENESQTKGRIIGESPSPTGYCAPIRTPSCIPCDPGLPGSTCVPESDWPPTRTTDIGTPEEAAPLVPPTTGPLGETAPQIAPPTAEDGTGQPPTGPLCPEGQVLDEETGLCVLEEPEAAEVPEQSQPEEQEQQQTEETQPSEEQGSQDSSNN